MVLRGRKKSIGSEDLPDPDFGGEVVAEVVDGDDPEGVRGDKPGEAPGVAVGWFGEVSDGFVVEVELDGLDTGLVVFDGCGNLCFPHDDGAKQDRDFFDDEITDVDVEIPDFRGEEFDGGWGEVGFGGELPQGASGGRPMVIPGNDHPGVRGAVVQGSDGAGGPGDVCFDLGEGQVAAEVHVVGDVVPGVRVATAPG